ncbi:MAG: hypothetical protein IJ343_08210, partial [Clostridia bacterium]|nr:hypothetical protein [Clostridia bacterium]
KKKYPVPGSGQGKIDPLGLNCLFAALPTSRDRIKGSLVYAIITLSDTIEKRGRDISAFFLSCFV